jgi:hypothetical protein
MGSIISCSRGSADPFREFIEKYDLGPAVETLTVYIQGFAGILNYPTVYILKLFNLNAVFGIQNGFLRPISQANADLYNAAREGLGEDALLSSNVVWIDRSDSGPHRILVRTPMGIIVAIPPLPDTLKNFDLDALEQRLFGKFNFSGYYTSVLNIPNYPANTIITNKGADKKKTSVAATCQHEPFGRISVSDRGQITI